LFISNKEIGIRDVIGIEMGEGLRFGEVLERHLIAIAKRVRGFPMRGIGVMELVDDRAGLFGFFGRVVFAIMSDDHHFIEVFRVIEVRE
jgi:hypothetical protein